MMQRWQSSRFNGGFSRVALARLHWARALFWLVKYDGSWFHVVSLRVRTCLASMKTDLWRISCMYPDRREHQISIVKKTSSQTSTQADFSDLNRAVSHLVLTIFIWKSLVCIKNITEIKLFPGFGTDFQVVILDLLKSSLISKHI